MTSPRQAVLILQGFSAYNNFTTFYGMVARSLRRRGFDPVFINLRDNNEFNSDMGGAVRDYTLDNILCALTLNGLGLEMGDSSPEGNLWGRLKIPVLSWMGDHPSYYLSRHQHKSSAITLMYEYKDYLDFHRQYVRTQGRVTYNPFGLWDLGKTPQKRQPVRDAVPLIVMPKTGHNPDELQKAWAVLPQKLQTIIQGAIQHYWSTTSRSGNVVNSVLVAAEDAHLALDNDLKLLSFLIVQVDDYIRRLKVKHMVETLLPFPVKIFGAGLDYIDASKAKAKIIPSIDYENLIELYYQALAIVTVNPNVDDECHDRVYSALGCGAMPVSDINPWWSKNYPDCLPYSFDFRDRPLSHAIESILSQPLETAEKAWQLHINASNGRTFDDTVGDAIEWAHMQRYFAYNFVSPQAYFSKGKD